VPRWEYLSINNLGFIVPASHRLQQVYQYLQGRVPRLAPKDLKVDDTTIRFPRFALIDIMNVLGADGWEVVGVDTPSTETIYILKRPTD